MRAFNFSASPAPVRTRNITFYECVYTHTHTFSVQSYDYFLNYSLFLK